MWLQIAPDLALPAYPQLANLQGKIASLIHSSNFVLQEQLLNAPSPSSQCWKIDELIMHLALGIELREEHLGLKHKACNQGRNQ